MFKDTCDKINRTDFDALAVECAGDAFGMAVELYGGEQATVKKWWEISNIADTLFHKKVDKSIIGSGFDCCEAISDAMWKLIPYVGNEEDRYDDDGDDQVVKTCSECGLSCMNNPKERFDYREMVFQNHHMVICSDCSIDYGMDDNGNIVLRIDDDDDDYGDDEEDDDDE